MTYEHHKDIQHKHDHHTNHPDIATDPVCSMHVDTSTAKYCAEHDHQAYYFCSAHCHGKFVAAPGSPANRAGKLSDLRHGIRTGGSITQYRTKCGTHGHEPPLLDWPHIDRTSLHLGNGWSSDRAGAFTISPNFKLAATAAGNTSRVVVRMAVFCTWLAIDNKPRAQYVHAHCDGHRCGMGL